METERDRENEGTLLNKTDRYTKKAINMTQRASPEQTEEWEFKKGVGE